MKLRQTIIDVTIPVGAHARQTIASMRYPQDFASIDYVTDVGSALAYVTGVMSSVTAYVHPGLQVAERAA